MDVKFGVKTLQFPGDRFGELEDSSDFRNDPAVLRERMADDGYLYLPGLLDRDTVLRARERIFEYMDEKGALVPGAPVIDGVMPKEGKTVNLLGNRQITHDSAVLDVLESEDLFGFFGELFDEPAVTFSYKWLRAVGNERFTGSHYDVVYMGRGSERVHTVWIPFGDTPIEHGTLAICEGSHRLPGFQKLRETYGRMDVDRDNVQGWFSDDPLEILDNFGGRWLTTNFQAGDVLTFGLYTMHASTTNTTNRYRLSCDVRYQPASEPMDERWGGDTPKGHYAWQREGSVVSMEEARAKWGV
jgi:hypothetical protein